MFWLLLCVFGLFAGMTTVLFGFGGGFVAVPLLFALVRARYPADSAIAHAAMHIAVANSTAAMLLSAGLTTLRHWRAGTLQGTTVRPLFGYIALGAALGACAAVALSGAWIRWGFIGYLSMTILDALLRPGFMTEPATTLRPLGGRASALIGLSIGAIAALLGVGGSVMSVPLLRRRGASMALAAALANLLSLPMAMAATSVYILLAWRMDALGAGFAGYIDLRALASLVLGSWCGIRLALPWVRCIGDGLHAKSYLMLLTTVLLVMLWV